MKKFKIMSILLLSGLVLSACADPTGNDGANGENGQTETTQTAPNTISQNRLGDGYYVPVLTEEGGYKTSNNRGITLNLNSGINISLFEKDLMRLSQGHFSTDNYLLQEGQFLTREIVTSWLGRTTTESTEDLSAEEIAERDFLNGLNPAQSPEFNPSTGVYNHGARVPSYLQSILEFDFYQESGSSTPSGLSIGLAMNTVDYYIDNEYRQWSQNISPEQALEQGQVMANEIVRRIRQIEEIPDIPIFIGIYEQAARDDLGGGVYVATGTSTEGSTAVQNWTTINEERIIFPLEGRDSSEGNAFANFQSEVENFFPDLSGITGQAHYIDDKMETLTINIMTQFFGETEMVAFTQYLKQSAATYLPVDLDVEIVVESPQSIEAFLKKDRTDSEYFAHVFN